MKNQPRKTDVPLEVVEPPAQHSRAPQPPLGGSSDEQEPTLRSYVETIISARWLMLAAMLSTLAAGGLYLLLATPAYQSDALIQVEERKSTISGLEDLTSMFGSQSPAETEIEILRSRMLVGSVVDELHLDVVARPRFFPIVGEGVARRHASDGPATPVLGLGSFAWGGEQIELDRLEVPKRWEGKPLTLVARGAGRYDLIDPAGKFIGSGDIERAFASGELSMFVSHLVARQGTQFRIVKLSRAKAIAKLQKDLVIAEKGKKTGILRLVLEGSVPARIPAILDAIARTYLRQNIDRKSAEAEKTLAFINGQLPKLRQSVDAAEATLNEYRAKNGSVDLSLEAKAALDRAVEVEKELSALDMQMYEARQRFTDSHPVMITAREKAVRLRSERSDIDARIKRLPGAELQSARLMRDVKVASELYVLLLNKAQELQVMKSGTIGNVRILDAAFLPQDPVSPNPRFTLAMSLFLGAAIGGVIAFTRKALDQGVEDPAVIERETRLPVYASVPHSPAQADLGRALRKKGSDTVPVLAIAHPDDLAVEAIRSLRTSLQFALGEASNNLVAITGPSPGIGKSFTCVNLAHVLADIGKRVLVADADLRKGRLHHYFGARKAPGLSDIIRGTAAENDAIQKTTAENLHFLPMGERPPNPSELLSSSRFNDLMAWASREYDVVLIDTPPVLAVTDAALACRSVGTTLLVLRAGQHAMREIALAVKRMEQNGVKPRAIILNDVMPRAAGYAYSDYHYHYDYK